MYKQNVFVLYHHLIQIVNESECDEVEATLAIEMLKTTMLATHVEAMLREDSEAEIVPFKPKGE